jgi:NAD(P)-dependent dehydrogenase (short-subunit alcohol dehydrogenase family)
MTTLDAFDMSGRRAIVTGACGLLGREFCGALVDVGAHVVGIDRAEAPLDELVDLGVEPRACDVTDQAQVDALVDGLSGERTLDAVVASAAIDPKVDPSGGVAARAAGDFATYPLDAWTQSLTVNLTGTFLVAQAVGRVMARQDAGRGRGSIVTISSTYGLTGPDQRLYADADGTQLSFKPVDYPTTKAGVLGFTRALAAYYRGTGIRVNSLSPGGAFKDHDPAFVARYSERTLLGRMASPSEYRCAIAFLCSDASSYMTGANLVVDGGWTAV